MDFRLKIFPRASVEDQSALMQHHDSRGKAFDLFRSMGSKKNGFSSVMHGVQQPIDLSCHLEVQARCGLIENEQRRIGQQGATDVYPLF